MSPAPNYQNTDTNFTTLSGSVQLCVFYNKYIDVTTISGVFITYLNNVNKLKCSIYNTNNKYTTSYHSKGYVFMGTTESGIRYICDDFVYNDSYNYDYTYHTINFASDENITSNYVIYIHCSDIFMLATTTSGVDCYDITTTSGYHYYTTFSGGKKCFVTNDSAYYIADHGTYETITVIKDIENNWDSPYKIYDTTPSGLLRGVTSISDIYVKDNHPDYNTIYCTTDKGLYEINEYDDSCSLYTSQ